MRASTVLIFRSCTVSNLFSTSGAGSPMGNFLLGAQFLLQIYNASFFLRTEVIANSNSRSQFTKSLVIPQSDTITQEAKTDTVATCSAGEGYLESGASAERPILNRRALERRMEAFNLEKLPLRFSLPLKQPTQWY